MVPKPVKALAEVHGSFRAVLFRMVPKLKLPQLLTELSFRAVLFRMVPKLLRTGRWLSVCFRAVLFQMVPKQKFF